MIVLAGADAGQRIHSGLVNACRLVTCLGKGKSRSQKQCQCAANGSKHGISLRSFHDPICDTKRSTHVGYWPKGHRLGRVTSYGTCSPASSDRPLSLPRISTAETE